MLRIIKGVKDANSIITSEEPGEAEVSNAITNTEYSKYLRVTVSSAGSVTINKQFGWSRAIFLPTLSSNVLTITSNAEFTSSMFANSNQGVNYQRVNSSTWEFELYNGFGTIVIEIYSYA
jgi:hypothetical protein